MAKLVAPETVNIELTSGELEIIRTGLRHTVVYGTVEEEDRAKYLLADLAQ
ncbi:hypothetical protein [Streptomyces sp. NPDC005302]|uniref:hypothetical protein n=1 Tax=Streptomyces sp. NPDC005302 TaxID=3154675 RepID=UPI0033B82554